MTLRKEIILLVDTREPGAPGHPWRPFLPPHVTLRRATIPTGDFLLAGAEDGAAVERKTAGDLVGCMTVGRERFERELLRARYQAAFCVVVEGSFSECLEQRGGLSAESFVGSIAAWTRRHRIPFVFAGNRRNAAAFAWRYLAQQFSESSRLVRAVEAKTQPAGIPATTAGLAGKQEN